MEKKNNVLSDDFYQTYEQKFWQIKLLHLSFQMVLTQICPIAPLVYLGKLVFKTPEWKSIS